MSVKESAKSTPCPELEADLVLFHYGELDSPERRRVEAHLKDCAACTQSLGALANLLTRTILADEPPPAFWNSYSRELRQKLAELDQAEPWWRKFLFTLQPWAMPALATSAVVALALTFTLGKGLWQEHDTPPAVDDAILEVLPMAENLDFFHNLEVLDALEFLELMNEQTKVAA
jgi:predicted anti-sigma-YlaC factor YlaD